MPTVHRVWLGPKEMPNNYKEFGNEWAELNPEWDVHDWTKEEVESLELQNRWVYDALAVPQPGYTIEPIALATQRADVLGYELIYQFGGLYVNCDIRPVKPLGVLADWIEAGWALAAREDDHWIVNAVLGGKAGHPFWKYVLDSLGPRYQARPYGPMNEVTGPFLLTECFQTWIHGNTLVLPAETFNPIHFGAIPHGTEPVYNVEDLPESCFGVHYWGHKMSDRNNFVNRNDI